MVVDIWGPCLFKTSDQDKAGRKKGRSVAAVPEARKENRFAPVDLNGFT
jgi:hypothetical protein